MTCLHVIFLYLSSLDFAQLLGSVRLTPIVLWFIRNIWLVTQITKVYFSYIYLVFIMVPQSFQNPWNFLSYKSNGSILCYIWSLVLSSWNHFRAINGKMVSYILFITSPVHHNWIYVNKMTLGMHLRVSTGCQGNQTSIVAFSPALGSTPLISEEEKEAGGWLIHQWPVI